VPRKFKTIKLCLTSILGRTENFRYIPKYLLTEDFCKLLISIDPYVLQYIPEKKLNHYLCLHAILKNIDVIDFIPEKFKTKEIINFVNNKNNEIGKKHFFSMYSI